jgi:hypothetical protein
MLEKMDIEKLKLKIDSVKVDIHKHNGNPFPAIIEAWYNKVEILLNHKDLFEQEFVNDLINFKLKFQEINSNNSTTDIGKHKERIQELVDKTFKEKLFKNKLFTNDNNDSIQSVKDAIDSIHFCNFEKGQLIFRGQTNSEWDILPSLFRKYQNFDDASMYEAITVGTIFNGIISPFMHGYDPIDQLMIAQHFGQPTRLIDWTFDILIALFFACYDPKNEQSNKNGRLTLAEKVSFKTLNTNSSDLTEYKNPLLPEKLETYKERFEINDIHFIEPLFKNPRMRVQDGCFMFFPWKYNYNDEHLLTLNKYIREHRNAVDKYNTDKKQKHPYIFFAHKDVDKKYKKEILSELDNLYGISAKTLFIDSKYSKDVENHFNILKSHAEVKTSQLSKK